MLECACVLHWQNIAVNSPSDVREFLQYLFQLMPSLKEKFEFEENTTGKTHKQKLMQSYLLHRAHTMYLTNTDHWDQVVWWMTKWKLMQQHKSYLLFQWLVRHVLPQVQQDAQTHFSAWAMHPQFWVQLEHTCVVAFYLIFVVKGILGHKIFDSELVDWLYSSFEKLLCAVFVMAVVLHWVQNGQLRQLPIIRHCWCTT